MFFIIFAVLLLVVLVGLMYWTSGSSTSSGTATVVVVDTSTTSPSSEDDPNVPSEPTQPWDPNHNPDTHLAQARLDYVDFSAKNSDLSGQTDFRVHFYRPSPPGPYSEHRPSLDRLDLPNFSEWVRLMMATPGVSPLPEDEMGGKNKYDIYLIQSDEKFDSSAGVSTGVDDDTGNVILSYNGVPLYGYSSVTPNSLSSTGETYVVINVWTQVYQEGTQPVVSMDLARKADVLSTTFHELYHSIHRTIFATTAPPSMLLLEGLATAAEVAYSLKLAELPVASPGYLTPELREVVLGNGGVTLRSYPSALSMFLSNEELPPNPPDGTETSVTPDFCTKWTYTAFVFTLLTVSLGITTKDNAAAGTRTGFIDAVCQNLMSMVYAGDIWTFIGRAYQSRFSANLPGSVYIDSSSDFVAVSQQPSSTQLTSVAFAVHVIVCFLFCLNLENSTAVYDSIAPFLHRPLAASLPPLFIQWAQQFSTMYENLDSSSKAQNNIAMYRSNAQELKTKFLGTADAEGKYTVREQGLTWPKVQDAFYTVVTGDPSLVDKIHDVRVIYSSHLANLANSTVLIASRKTRTSNPFVNWNESMTFARSGTKRILVWNIE